MRLFFHQLICSLLLSGAVRDSWTLAADLFSKAIDLLGGVGSSHGERYLRALSETCTASAHELAATQWLNSRESRNVELAVRHSEEATTDALISGKTERMWTEMIADFSRGPMAAN